MNMRWYKAVIIFIIVFIVQATLLWRMPVYGYAPNLLLCFLCVFSFLYDERYGLILGTSTGVLLDIAS